MCVPVCALVPHMCLIFRRSAKPQIASFTTGNKDLKLSAIKTPPKTAIFQRKTNNTGRRRHCDTRIRVSLLPRVRPDPRVTTPPDRNPFSPPSNMTGWPKFSPQLHHTAPYEAANSPEKEGYTAPKRSGLRPPATGRPPMPIRDASRSPGNR